MDRCHHRYHQSFRILCSRLGRMCQRSIRGAIHSCLELQRSVAMALEAEMRAIQLGARTSSSRAGTSCRSSPTAPTLRATWRVAKLSRARWRAWRRASYGTCRWSPSLPLGGSAWDHDRHRSPAWVGVGVQSWDRFRERARAWAMMRRPLRSRFRRSAADAETVIFSPPSCPP